MSPLIMTIKNCLLIKDAFVPYEKDLEVDLTPLIKYPNQT